MKIRIDRIVYDRITYDDFIEFSNGDKISFDHDRDCCERNYADFRQLEPFALEYEFEMPIQFESAGDWGFRFGDDNMKFFVPCYSEQSGWYSNEIEIYYNDKKVLDIEAEKIY